MWSARGRKRLQHATAYQAWPGQRGRPVPSPSTGARVLGSSESLQHCVETHGTGSRDRQVVRSRRAPQRRRVEGAPRVALKHVAHTPMAETACAIVEHQVRTAVAGGETNHYLSSGSQLSDRIRHGKNTDHGDTEWRRGVRLEPRVAGPRRSAGRSHECASSRDARPVRSD